MKDNLHYRVVKGKDRYVALASTLPIPEDTTVDDVFTLPDPVWFEFGKTPEEALSNLELDFRME